MRTRGKCVDDEVTRRIAPLRGGAPNPSHVARGGKMFHWRTRIARQRLFARDIGLCAAHVSFSPKADIQMAFSRSTQTSYDVASLADRAS